VPELKLTTLFLGSPADSEMNSEALEREGQPVGIAQGRGRTARCCRDALPNRRLHRSPFQRSRARSCCLKIGDEEVAVLVEGKTGGAVEFGVCAGAFPRRGCWLHRARAGRQTAQMARRRVGGQMAHHLVTVTPVFEPTMEMLEIELLSTARPMGTGVSESSVQTCMSRPPW